jgi:PAS domain S-box-containing protein
MPTPPLLVALPPGYRVALVGLGYFLLAQAAFLISPQGADTAVFWPAGGLLLAALATHSPRSWAGFLPLPFLADLAACHLWGKPFEVGLVQSSAHVLAALLGAWMVRSCPGPNRRGSRLCRALCLIAAGAGVAGAASATLLAWAEATRGGIEAFAPFWLTNWAGEAIGVLSTAPVLLAWVEVGSGDLARRRTGSAAETALICGATGLLAWLVATNRLFPSPQIDYYLLLPVLAWALVRLDPPGTALAGFVLSAVSLASIGGWLCPGAGAEPIGPYPTSAHIYLLSALTTLHVLAEALAERRDAMRATERSKACLGAMLDTMPYQAWLKDASGRYLAVNQAFAREAGTPAETIVGHTDRDFLPPERAGRFAADDARTLASEGQLFLEERIPGSDGRDRWFETFRATFRDQDGAVAGTVGISRDYTSRKRLDEELVRSRVAAEDASQAKSEFLATMSHEIRAPLSGIMGALRMSLLDELPARQRNLLGMALDTADSLLSIINDILDFSRIEARRFELSPVDFNLPEALQRLLNPFCLQAEQKGLALSLSLAPDVPHDLHGDPDRLGQVVRNLVSNAIKFSRTGAIRVGVSRLESADRSHHLRFTVTDQGIGIPRDKLPCLFRSFSQVHPEGGGYGGSGLGLAISKRLVELMGGDIGVESVQGQGSTFHFTVWFSEAAGESVGGDWIKAGGDSGASQPLPPLRVLVADDTRLSRMFVTHFLEGQGHSVTCAEDGLEVLEALGRQKFDVVLMDVRMPQMDGIAATAAIRADASGRFDPHVPIIALTAHAMIGDKERFLAAGMDDYVSKPVDLDELFAVLRRVLQRQTVAGGLGDPALHQETRRVRVLDEGVIKRRFAGNREFWINLVRELTANQLPPEREDLARAVAAGDLEEVRKLAHKIKGSCGTVGAMPAYDAAQRLETTSPDEAARRLEILEGELSALTAAAEGLNA